LLENCTQLRDHGYLLHYYSKNAELKVWTL
jgi:hypothetical protein